MIPEGYVNRRTDERIQVMATRMTKAGAERHRRAWPPTFPSYHLRVERAGFLRWEVVAYQNVLTPVDGRP